MNNFRWKLLVSRTVKTILWAFLILSTLPVIIYYSFSMYSDLTTPECTPTDPVRVVLGDLALEIPAQYQPSFSVKFGEKQLRTMHDYINSRGTILHCQKTDEKPVAINSVSFTARDLRYISEFDEKLKLLNGLGVLVIRQPIRRSRQGRWRFFDENNPNATIIHNGMYLQLRETPTVNQDYYLRLLADLPEGVNLEANCREPQSTLPNNCSVYVYFEQYKIEVKLRVRIEKYLRPSSPQFFHPPNMWPQLARTIEFFIGTLRHNKTRY